MSKLEAAQRISRVHVTTPRTGHPLQSVNLNNQTPFAPASMWVRIGSRVGIPAVDRIIAENTAAMV